MKTAVQACTQGLICNKRSCTYIGSWAQAEKSLERPAQAAEASAVVSQPVTSLFVPPVDSELATDTAIDPVTLVSTAAEHFNIPPQVPVTQDAELAPLPIALQSAPGKVQLAAAEKVQLASLAGPLKPWKLLPILRAKLCLTQYHVRKKIVYASLKAFTAQQRVLDKEFLRELSIRLPEPALRTCNTELHLHEEICNTN